MAGMVAAVGANPYTRRQVWDCVRTLADPEYQERVWIRRELPTLGFEDSFWMTVGELFDGTAVLPVPKHPEASLRSSEVDAFVALGAELDPMLDRLGSFDDDERYLRDAQWPAVVAAAKRCVEAMSTP